MIFYFFSGYFHAEAQKAGQMYYGFSVSDFITKACKN